MTYWLTQSLLSSWLYFLNADEERSGDAWTSFVSTLRREEREPTQAMQDGKRFEDMINRLVAGYVPEGEYNAKWDAAARRFAARCFGGLSQVPVTGDLTVSGINFCLYGVCDYVKAGLIMDIKKVVRYEYGKYQHSPQHPMYLHLLPEAKRFDYLIFDGANCHVETYRREDCKPIDQTIAEFLWFLTDTGWLDVYKKFWAMNEERWQKRGEAQ